MKYGFWMPIFGGWLRNVDDENMPPTFAYAKEVAQKAEQWGYDTTLVAELYLNDIKGPEEDVLEALVDRRCAGCRDRYIGDHDRRAPRLPQPGCLREDGGEHRPHLERSLHAEHRVGVVGGGSEAVRRRICRTR